MVSQVSFGKSFIKSSLGIDPSSSIFCKIEISVMIPYECYLGQNVIFVVHQPQIFGKVCKVIKNVTITFYFRVCSVSGFNHAKNYLKGDKEIEWYIWGLVKGPKEGLDKLWHFLLLIFMLVLKILAPDLRGWFSIMGVYDRLSKDSIRKYF